VYLTDGGTGSTATYFRDHWFNIETKWTHLGHRHLPTFGNNTNNRLERFHHTIKDVLQKTQRLVEVLKNLVNIAMLRLGDRKLKQNIRDLRFATKSKHPLLKKFAESVSPYAWSKREEEIKIMKKKSYDFVLDKV
ncbi:Uncharacterized protein APZ42_007911, partial [Daphnia magna]